jgi:hypothetical protein
MLNKHFLGTLCCSKQYYHPRAIGDDGVMLALLDGLKLDQYAYLLIVTMKIVIPPCCYHE